MSQPKLIGLIGASGAGKSSVARNLEQQGYVIIPMSCVLKDMLKALGFGPDDLEGDQAYRLTPQERFGGMSPREVAQSLGTEWARDIVHPDLLVNAVRARIAVVVRSGLKVCVDGMRFPNEADMIRSLGGEIWCVERPGVGPVRTVFDRMAAWLGWFPRIHESEYHWPYIHADVTIRNDSNTANLRGFVGDALRAYPRRKTPCAHNPN